MIPGKKNSPIDECNSRCLVLFEKRFLASIKDWRNAQMPVLRQRDLLTDSDQEEWYKKISGDQSQLIFGLSLRDKNKMTHIGYCGITNIDVQNSRGEISFLVDPKRAADEKTYEADMLAALAMLCKYAFATLRLHKLFADTFSFRKKHTAILEKFGFNLDGRMREHYLSEGRFIDSLIHSILISDKGADIWTGKTKG
jgi:RimJ/RimL family protein N-acetyltransferase